MHGGPGAPHPEASMRKLLPVLALVIVATSCGKGTRVPGDRPAEQSAADPLRAFFMLCERDMERASAVIEKRALIDNLTHLQLMNSGGDRFYLLERDGITEMLRAVTQGTYSDFILVNGSGTVVYTMANDDLFAKSLKTYKPDSPLGRCFGGKKEPLHLEDVSEFPRSSGRYRMLIAGNVYQQGALKGVFILQLDMEKILHAAGEGAVIASMDGLVRVDARKESLMNPLVTDDGTAAGTACARGPVMVGGKPRPCRIFGYDDLKWMVIGAP
jgi:hypothetical protein